MAQKILERFRREKTAGSRRLAKKLGISRQAVHRHLVLLIKKGQIVKQGTSRKTSFYVLNEPRILRRLGGPSRKFRKRFSCRGLEEDRVYEEMVRIPYFLSGLGKEAREIFRYTFTEMLNNAIDHSQSRLIDVCAEADARRVRFDVVDKGVGVFENIRSQKGLSSELEALQDLLKGRQTTNPERHSGEGIFFTSRASDFFVLSSHRKRLIVDNRRGDFFIETIRQLKGTTVTVETDCTTHRRLGDLFRQYTNEDFKFHKTDVTVRLYEEGNSYVSRSQAKRLLHALGDFEEVILDFKGVKSIGQGFADEIFRVYALKHPQIRFVLLHADEDVMFMIQRARQ